MSTNPDQHRPLLTARLPADNVPPVFPPASAWPPQAAAPTPDAIVLHPVEALRALRHATAHVVVGAAMNVWHWHTLTSELEEQRAELARAKTLPMPLPPPVLTGQITARQLAPPNTQTQSVLRHP